MSWRNTAAAWLTEGNVLLVRELWDAGVSTREMARRIGHGCTRNAIVGYAHRHGFPPRPSPIGNRHNTLVVPRVPHKGHHKGSTEPYTPRKAPVPVVVTAPPALPPAPVVWSPFRTCQWIPASVTRRPWRMCGAPTSRGAWCSEHFAKVYSRSARQEAAAP